MFVSSKKNPKKPCYVLSDDNHIGWYFGGNVYFFVYKQCKSEPPEPQSQKLSEWCKKYTELANVCDKEKFVQAGGHPIQAIWIVE